MKPSDFLKKGWTPLSLSVDKHGRDVRPSTHPKAKSFSLTGAMIAAGLSYTENWKTFLNTVVSILGLGGIAEVDKWEKEPGRTKEEVISLAVQAERLMGL